MEKWTKPQKRTAETDMTNVVDINTAAEKNKILATDSLGNPIGTATSPEEAREKQIQANIDAREAA